MSASMLRGTVALLRSRPATLKLYPLWAGLAPSIGLGLLARLGGGSPDALAELVGVSAIAACFVAPLAGTLPWTSSLQLNSPSRRDELATLPIGRLALPVAGLLVSLLTLLLWALAVGLGLSLTLGTRAVGALLASPQLLEPLGEWGLHAAFGVFALGWGLGAAGGSSAAIACLWPLAPFAVVAALQGMGYDRETTHAVARSVATIVGLYLALLPFLLYAQPVGLWAASRQKDREAPHVTAMGTSLLALITLAVAGAGVELLLVLGVGAALSLRAARARAPGDRTSAVRLVHVTGLAVMLPLTAVGLVVDARAGARPGRFDEVQAALESVSPDGRHATVVLMPRTDGRTRALTHQVAVVDLTGERPPLLVPARFAALPATGAWSSDGRWLAVEDATMGRLEVPFSHAWESPDDPGPLERAALRARLALDETWLVDTQAWTVERRGALDVAPGWSRPEELRRTTLGSDAGWALVGSDGAELTVPQDRPQQALQIVGYADGGALLVDRWVAATRRDDSIGAIPSTLRCAREAALEVVDASAGRWLEVWPRSRSPEERGVFQALRLVRDGRELELEGLYTVALAASDATSIIASDESGLVRIAVEGGARTTLLARDGPSALSVRWTSGDGRRLVVVGRRDGAWAVDLTTDRAWSVPPETRALSRDDRPVVVGPDGWPALYEEPASPR